MMMTVKSKLIFTNEINRCSKIKDKINKNGNISNAFIQNVNITTVSSGPHFAQASPEIMDKVEGIAPNDDDHVTILYYEPTTGSPIKTQKRLQVNYLLSPQKEIK